MNDENEDRIFSVKYYEDYYVYDGKDGYGHHDILGYTYKIYFDGDYKKTINVNHYVKDVQGFYKAPPLKYYDSHYNRYVYLNKEIASFDYRHIASSEDYFAIYNENNQSISPPKKSFSDSDRDPYKRDDYFIKIGSESETIDTSIPSPENVISWEDGVEDVITYQTGYFVNDDDDDSAGEEYYFYRRSTTYPNNTKREIITISNKVFELYYDNDFTFPTFEDVEGIPDELKTQGSLPDKYDLHRLPIRYYDAELNMLMYSIIYDDRAIISNNWKDVTDDYSNIYDYQLFHDYKTHYDLFSFSLKKIGDNEINSYYMSITTPPTIVEKDIAKVVNYGDKISISFQFVNDIGYPTIYTYSDFNQKKTDILIDIMNKDKNGNYYLLYKDPSYGYSEYIADNFNKNRTEEGEEVADFGYLIKKTFKTVEEAVDFVYNLPLKIMVHVGEYYFRKERPFYLLDAYDFLYIKNGQISTNPSSNNNSYYTLYGTMNQSIISRTTESFDTDGDGYYDTNYEIEKKRSKYSNYILASPSKYSDRPFNLPPGGLTVEAKFGELNNWLFDGKVILYIILDDSEYIDNFIFSNIPDEYLRYPDKYFSIYGDRVGNEKIVVDNFLKQKGLIILNISYFYSDYNYERYKHRWKRLIEGKWWLYSDLHKVSWDWRDIRSAINEDDFNIFRGVVHVNDYIKFPQEASIPPIYYTGSTSVSSNDYEFINAPKR